MSNKTKWFTVGVVAAMFATTPALAADAASREKQAKGRKVEVSVTKDGFVPAEIPAKKGEVLNLVVTRKVERTCATELVQKDQGVYAPLPLDKPVTVTLTAPPDGQLKFSCAHGHIAGNVDTDLDVFAF